jgi:hypothetical protein
VLVESGEQDVTEVDGPDPVVDHLQTNVPVPFELPGRVVAAGRADYDIL